MRNFRRLLPCLTLLALLAITGRTFAADVVVIANAAVAMTPEEVKEVFLGELQFSGALKLRPIDNAGAQPEFLSGVLRMTGTKYSAWWTKKAFREGLEAPLLKATDAEVLMFVKGNPGAIGYVTSAPHGVYVVGRF
jgi:hypothetical protein